MLENVTWCAAWVKGQEEMNKLPTCMKRHVKLQLDHLVHSGTKEHLINENKLLVV